MTASASLYLYTQNQSLNQSLIKGLTETSLPTNPQTENIKHGLHMPHITDKLNQNGLPIATEHNANFESSIQSHEPSMGFFASPDVPVRIGNYNVGGGQRTNPNSYKPMAGALSIDQAFRFQNSHR